jgi:hypothetical protein
MNWCLRCQWRSKIKQGWFTRAAKVHAAPAPPSRSYYFLFDNEASRVEAVWIDNALYTTMFRLLARQVPER